MKRPASLLLLPLLGALAYLPGLSGGFVFDDYQNIIENPYLRLEQLDADGLLAAAQSSYAGPLSRPLAMLSFAFNHYLHGAVPFGYKVTNLAIHCLNAALVYWLALLLLRTPALVRRAPGVPAHGVALVAALAWLVHPLNLTTVLYVVQRMNGLAALFTFAGLVWYLHFRLRMQAGRGGFGPLVAGTLGWTALAVLCKENGVLLPVFALACELLLLRPFAAPAERRRVDGFFVAVVVAPAIIAAVYVIAHPGALTDPYAWRPFSLGERLLTEARVLWFYLGLMLAPTAPRMGLFHDDFPVSAALLAPATTAAALAGLAALLALAWWARRRQPLLALAILWYFVAHAIESTALGLELVHEHRNYVAMVGPLLALAGYGWAWLGQPGVRRALRIVVLGWLALLGTVTFARAYQWSDPVTLALAEAQYHPRSYRAQYELGRIYYGLYTRDGDPHQYALALEQFERSARLDRYSPLPFFALIRQAYLGGGEPRAQWFAEAGHRLQTWPVQTPVVSAFSNLVECQVGGSCAVPAGRMLDLFGAVLANPTLRADLRAQILTQLAAYYANHAGDLEAAVRVMQDAVAVEPDSVHHRLNLVRVLIGAERLGEAREALAAAAERASRTRAPLRRRVLRGAIADLERQIAAAPEAG